VTLKIADSGMGIDEASVKKIFDPFFTTKSVGKGTGLGLSVSFGIVKDHMGEIAVESPLPDDFDLPPLAGWRHQRAGSDFHWWTFRWITVPLTRCALRWNSSGRCA
jgi:Signal transduction histidine kinase